MEHDLDRSAQVEDRSVQVEGSLAQCLSQSKRHLGLLLGAGCPAAIEVPGEDGGNKGPLIPAMAGLTESANRALNEAHSDYRDLLSRLAEDLGRAPNIEEILSHVRGLALIVGKREVHGLDRKRINELETAITTHIAKIVTVELPDGRTPYDDVAIWAQAVAQDIAIRIFTTNYDLLLEDAFEKCGVPFFDGFAGARKPFLDTTSIEKDDLPPRWIRIIKLHGSSNWSVQEDGSVIRSSVKGEDERHLIHPSHLKYAESRRMPYLIMFDQLRDFFKDQSATLITIGYSFSDNHINDLLCQGLRSNPSAKIFGLLYEDLKAYELAAALALQHPRLTLIANDGGIDAGVEFISEMEDNGRKQPLGLGEFKKFGERLRRSVGRAPASHVSQNSPTAESDDARP